MASQRVHTQSEIRVTMSVLNDLIDEHRFRKVRYARSRTWKVIRIEPWSIVFTDLDTGKILDIVDGRTARRSGEDVVEVPAKVLASTSTVRGH